MPSTSASSEFGATWAYDIEPRAGGCQISESTWDRRPGWYAKLTALVTGIEDRPAVNTVNI